MRQEDTPNQTSEGTVCVVGLWAVKFPSMGDPVIQEGSPWTAGSGTGLCSETPAFEVMVTEMVVFQALDWDIGTEHPGSSEGALPMAVGVPGFI